MKASQMITTGDVAAHCNVTYNTVNNWIRQGQLKASRTPGRHSRIHLSDFSSFLKQHALPPFEDPSFGNLKVLVVDDETSTVAPIVRFLKRSYECDVEVAYNGFDAGLQVERFQPDLVILDIMMPHVDGFEVCTSIKSNPATQSMKVIVVTGYKEEGFIVKALECGADDWLGKPFLLKELDELVSVRRVLTS